jgi:succinate-semialdehyde dehydrogenase/glutarate-semialdehyde dehydrogenase
MTASLDRRTIETIDPSTGEQLASYPLHTQAELEDALARAHKAFTTWRGRPLEERTALLRRAGAYLREHKAELATLATREMGKTIVEAEAEVEKCATCCDHYAEHAAAYLAHEEARSTASRSYVAFRPLGVVLAVMPWNFPFWQVFRFAAPALAAGNVGVLKHAANVTGCALAIERVFRESGFPEGTFTTLVVRGSETSALIADKHIAAVTLTGSEDAGSSVASAAGKALKKTVLELGGSDAFIVLADADVEAAAKIAVRARFQNNGQSCIAAKRFIVEAPVYDAFLGAFVRNTRELRIKPPLDRDSQLGPVAREDLLTALEGQIQGSLAKGATLATGGKRVDLNGGYYFEPTIVSDVTDDMPVFVEETFGPAAAVVRADDIEHAVSLANDSNFGLGGNLWTRDIARAEALAARLESGAVFINGMTASDSRLPFGGVKRSGYGRELSHFGMREFLNIQTVWIGPVRDEHKDDMPAE